MYDIQLEIGIQSVTVGSWLLTKASKKNNQADTDQLLQTAQAWCPAAEIEQIAPSILNDSVFIWIAKKNNHFL